MKIFLVVVLIYVLTQLAIRASVRIAQRRRIKKLAKSMT